MCQAINRRAAIPHHHTVGSAVLLSIDEPLSIQQSSPKMEDTIARNSSIISYQPCAKYEAQRALTKAESTMPMINATTSEFIGLLPSQSCLLVGGI